VVESGSLPRVFPFAGQEAPRFGPVSAPCGARHLESKGGSQDLSTGEEHIYALTGVKRKF